MRKFVGAWREPFVVLPPVGPLRRLAVVTLVDSLGTGLFLTVSALFFTGVVGLSVAEVATGLSVAGLAALLAAIPLGSWGDRFGLRRAWILLTLVNAAAFAVLPLVRSFPLFLAATTAMALADVGISPVRGAYLSLLAGPATRVRARAYNQVVVNVGFAVGAAGAGVVLALDTPAAYVALLLASSASYLVAAVVLRTLPAVTPPRPGRSTGSVLRDRRYLLVSVLNGLLMTYLAVLTVALPLWIAHRTDAPAWSVGALAVVNTALVVTCQVRASRGADTVPGAARAVRRAGVALLLACLVLAGSGLVRGPAALAVLTVGMIVLTAAELFHSAGSWGLSFGLAPEDRQGEYLGAFAMGGRVYDTIGPVLVTGLVLGLGTAGWVVLGVLFLVLAGALAKAGTRTAPDGALW